MESNSRKTQILKEIFGYDSFRKGQEEIVDQILNGRDVLAIMPTGAGKSLCYQVPALLMSGITIVVSPLISLMIDQVKALNEAGVHAAYINSALTERQITKALELAAAGRYKMIYVAPERLLTPRFLDFACHTELSMVTIDEAHCISQWGQDFRPSYVKITEFIRQLPRRPVVSAFTATATQKVREDILEVLDLESPYINVSGFDRENLYFEVRPARGKKDAIKEYLTQHREDSGIIYCATRKNVDELYLELQNAGFSVGRYHAGMGTEARNESQEDFIYDRIEIMIATNAFGMGIDKSNVRFVLHYNMPQSMENYYQEAGRAGRDGEPAECILFYSPQDIMINQLLLDSKEQIGEYTEEELRVIREQDVLRLRKMSNYCTTSMCLRKYILNYFGQETEEHCGNCSNCLEEFVELDVGEIAADVIECVRESRQRYGMTMILSTLAGANTAKIRSAGMNELSVYGRQSKCSQQRLKDVIYTLLEHGYLQQSADRYAILKLTDRSEELLESRELKLRCKKSELTEKKKSGSGKKASHRKGESFGNLTDKSRELFEELRSMRYSLAKKKGIPAVPCLPVIYAENPITAGNEKIMEKEMDLSGYPYVLEQAEEVEEAYLEKIRCRLLGRPCEILQTRRCIVREICLDDVDKLYEIYADPSITLYMEGLYAKKEEEIAYTRDYIRYQYGIYDFGMWIIEDRQSGEVIGRAGLDLRPDREDAELGYMIRKNRQGQGLAYEVCTAILAYTKEELGFEKLFARTRKENLASVMLLKKLGFHPVCAQSETKEADNAQIEYYIELS